MDGMMRCAVFRNIGEIVVEERPIPPCPEDGLLIKVHFCGICGGTSCSCPSHGYCVFTYWGLPYP